MYNLFQSPFPVLEPIRITPRRCIREEGCPYLIGPPKHALLAIVPRR